MALSLLRAVIRSELESPRARRVVPLLVTAGQPRAACAQVSNEHTDLALENEPLQSVLAHQAPPRDSLGATEDARVAGHTALATQGRHAEISSR